MSAIVAALVALAPGSALGAATLRSPGLPKTYLLQYSDQIALPGNPAGASVTPDGNVYNGWGELDFSVGGEGFDPQSHTLDQGRIPIVRAFRVNHGTLYTLTTFTASVLGNPVVFARVEVKNLLGHANGARVRAAFLNDAGVVTPRPLSCCTEVYRFLRPKVAGREGLYSQPGVPFNPASVYGFAGRSALLRDGQSVLFYPSPGGARVTYALRSGGTTDRKTEWGVANYAFRLPAYGHRQLDFKLPSASVPAGSPLHYGISHASLAARQFSTRLYFRRLFGAATRITVPERKVVDTYYASLANMALPRYVSGGGWVQPVNNLRYHAFWLRDAAMITRTFDLVGLHNIARQNLPFFLGWQDPTGIFISRPQEYDGFGQALWAFGEHYRRSHDVGFARQVYPAVQRAMAWFQAQRASDPLGLMPAVANSSDNDLIPGHLTGDNFWAAAGIAAAADLARGVGDGGSAAAWTAELNSFKANLRGRIAAVAPRGPIPPSLDQRGGQIWGNLWGSYIGDVYPATSVVVQNTLRRARRSFREGILTYFNTRLLHHYSGFRVFETEVAANQQLNAVKGLYSELAHTTGTNAGWEAGTAPFGDRVIDDATVPHGWWAAEYVTLLRNMMVRESGSDVYLMSALSRSWLDPGRAITVRNGRTTRGTVNFRLSATKDGAVLSWSSRLAPGTRLLWPVPYAARSVRAAGLSGRVITLHGGSGRLTVHWSLAGQKLTFEGTFDGLERSYMHSRNGAVTHRALRDLGRRRAQQDLNRYVTQQLR